MHIKTGIAIISVFLASFFYNGNGVVNDGADSFWRYFESDRGPSVEYVNNGKTLYTLYGVSDTIKNLILDVYTQEYVQGLKEEAQARNALSSQTPGSENVMPTGTVGNMLYAKAKVNTYVNVRSGPGTSNTAIARLYGGALCEIKDNLGEWAYVKSGDITGYVSTKYLEIGISEQEAGQILNKQMVTVNTSSSNLNVRSSMSTASSNNIITSISKGTVCPVIEVVNDWTKIKVSTGVEGYVSSKYVIYSSDPLRFAISVADDVKRLEADETLQYRTEADVLRKDAIAAIKAGKSTTEAYKEKGLKQVDVLYDTMVSPTTSKSDKLRAKICLKALTYVGLKYVWGGESLTTGADCSGFVRTLYKMYGYSMDRVSADQSRTAGYCSVETNVNSLLPGDLIFYYSESEHKVHHVAMYIGNGLVVHESNKNDGVKVSTYTLEAPYNARRVIR